MKKCLLLAIVAYTLCFVCRTVSAATISPVDVTVGATVEELYHHDDDSIPPSDEERFAVYGYTSPDASVKIQSPIFGETKADNMGFYEFKYLFVTLLREDLCIVATDTDGRSTPPLCIPPPTAQANKRVGPIILPPSTSISAGSAYIGDTVTLTGQTIPNVEVQLSLFTDENQKAKTLSLIPEAYAYTIPQVSLSSNAKGEYSVVLPTANSQFMRMFSRAIFEGNSTPKSLTLILDIFPLWMILFKFFSSFFSLLKAHLLELIILSQLYFLLLYGLRRFLNPRFLSSHRHRELALVHEELALAHEELALIPHEMALRREARLMRRNTALVARD